MRADMGQRQFCRGWIRPLLVSLVLGAWCVPAFVGVVSDGREHGRTWLCQPLGAPSGGAPSSTDPSKPILRRAHSEKHLQSRIVLLSPRARSVAAMPSEDGPSAEKSDGAVPRFVVHHLPIKRAPPVGPRRP